MEREELDIGLATVALRGETIVSVEFVSGGSDRDEDDYLVIRTSGDFTLYANAPTVYAPKQ